jgi:capsid portal protein
VKRDGIQKVQLAVAGVGLDVSGESTQAEAQAGGDPWTPDGAVQPPLSLDSLAGLTKVSRMRRSCIAAVAHNTVGLGYELKVKEGHEDEIDGDPTEYAREARAALGALSQRDRMLKRPSFTKQQTTVSWDKYEVGNGYLEVARNRLTGKISGLFHAPGKRLRRLKDRTGWVMLNRAGGSIPGDGIRFYDFGEKVAYDDDGAPQPRVARNGLRWETNEIIPFQLYTSESRDYGLPPDAQLSGDYLGDKLAGDTNISFFGSSGVPPTVIFVHGEETEKGQVTQIEVDPRFVAQVQDALRGGPNARGRVAIIGVPSGFQAQVENLAVTSERDMGFIAYRGDNRRASLAAYRLSPVFVADIEDAGKYTAEVERAITKEQVFDPEQQDVEAILNGTIVAELFPHLEIVFDELAIKGDEAVRESANDAADRGVITRREYRTAHGYGPLPEADAGAEPQAGEVPHGWNDELVPLRAPGPARPGETPATPAAEPGLIAKGVPSLDEAIREDFDAAIDEALREVHEKFPDVATAPIVVEKDGDDVRITRREGIGA